MHMLYNSDSYVVLRFDVPAETGESATPALRGGFEIVDKAAGKEIYIEGALAERFTRGVQALVDEGASSPEVFDDYIAGFAGLAQQPVTVH